MEPYFAPRAKTGLKQIKGLNRKPKSTEPLEENEEKPHDVRFGNDFLDTMPKEQKQRKIRVTD